MRDWSCWAPQGDRAWPTEGPMGIPDAMASASFEVAVTMAFAAALRRPFMADDLRILWGNAAGEEFLSSTTDGDTEAELNVAWEAVCAREQARPRPGPRGFLSGGQQ